MHGNLQSAVMLCYAKMFNIPLRDVMRARRYVQVSARNIMTGFFVSPMVFFSSNPVTMHLLPRSFQAEPNMCNGQLHIALYSIMSTARKITVCDRVQHEIS